MACNAHFRLKPPQSVMLTAESFRWLIFGLNTTNLIGSTPYRWNGKTNKVEYDDSLLRKVIWCIHNWMYLGYEFYVFVRWIIVAFFLESPTTPTALGTMYVWMSYNYAMAIQFSIWRHYGQHHIWINNFLEYFDEFQRRHNIELKAKKGSKLEIADASKAMIRTTAIIALVYYLDLSSVFSWPAAPFFTSSLLPDPMSQPFVNILPFAGYHCYIWFHNWFSVFFYAYTMLCYLCGVKNIMNFLKLKADTRGLGAHKDNLELTMSQNDSTAFSEEYRRLQIMQVYTNNLWGTTNILYEVIFIIGAVLGFYGSVRLKGARALQQMSVGIFYFATLIHLWTNMSEVHETSLVLLDDWKDMAKDKWFRRFLWSTRPARMNIGSFYFADREIILTIIQVITNNTINLIMSTSSTG